MNKERLRHCHETIAPYIHRTPVLTSTQLNQMTGAQLYFKCENFQKMGAFKMRGAAFAISQLSPEARSKGVVTHSSGNFAQALALAAQSLGVPAYIVMTTSAPEVKKDAVRGYGGQIILCAPTNTDREETAARVARETGATFIHPSNDADVITGQGTAAKELLEDFPDIEVLIAPVGGGGLIAGTIIAAQSHSHPVQVLGGEPFAVDDAYRSLQSGKIESNATSNTIADGLKTQLGDINFPIILGGIQEIIRVEEDEIISAMRLIWERMKIIIEPSCAVPLAAILKQPHTFKNKRVGVILSGGNVDLNNLPFSM